MKATLSALLATLLAALFPSPSVASPVVLGLNNKHPLAEPQVGELLLGELRCLACHTRKGVSLPFERAAPDLSDVGSRLAPDYLRAFIASPSRSHAGTTMPDLLACSTDEQRNAIAESIAHFLIAQSPRRFQRDPSEGKDPSEGRSLFHTIGCVACHSPRDDSGKETTREGVVGLDHVPAKYSLASLGEFLANPGRVRPSGRMPDMKLTPTEAKSLSEFLIGKTDATSKALSPQETLAELGKKHFRQLNCAACHKLGEIPAAPRVKDLQEANLDRGCLSKTPGPTPRFDLSDEQTKAIRSAIAKGSAPLTDKTLLATTLTAFNCIGCHIRDDFGGAPADRNLFFQTSAKNLGEDARIPPPLTLAGAKLQPVWMKKVLFDGDSVRPYMFTRMPQYGEANLRHVPELFASLDEVAEVKFSLPNAESPNKEERTRAQTMRDAGRKLLGNTSLNCVACHNFNGKTPQNNGIEMLTSFQRLRPSWFYRFLVNPNAFRPRTVMPVAWPGGVAADQSILGGDTHRQIEAIWYFLSLGTSAPDPAGVTNVETKLAVSDAARTYRGRSSVAGYRGIAVGFPEKVSYAFNAETGSLSAIWRGEFIRVDRGGQGSGGFHPASKHVGLGQDVAFYRLPDEKTPWPLRPVMNKEVRANPDPLYPKNRGYQFKGYYLDDASIPTFMYRSGEIAIEDRSSPGSGTGDSRLERKLTFDAPKAETLWFRPLTGKIEAESKQRYRTPELRIDIPAAHALLRPIAADALELLLKLEIPQGKSHLTLTYELLK